MSIKRRKLILYVISCFCLVVSKEVQCAWDACFSHMSYFCCLKSRNKLSACGLRSLIARQHMLSRVLRNHYVSINILIRFFIFFTIFSHMYRFRIKRVIMCLIITRIQPLHVLVCSLKLIASIITHLDLIL